MSTRLADDIGDGILRLRIIKALRRVLIELKEDTPDFINIHGYISTPAAILAVLTYYEIGGNAILTGEHEKLLKALGVLPT